MAEKKDVKRYKCMNFGACTKADQGTIIEIDALETIGGTPDCPHCHQHTLEELIVKKSNWKIIGGIIAAGFLLIGVGAALLFTGEEEKTGEEILVADTTSTLKVDSTKIEKKTVEEEPNNKKTEKAEEETTTTETIVKDKKPVREPSYYDLGWGRYEGPYTNGIPDGFGGTITVRSSYNIDLKKASGETVEVRSGDKIMNVKMENGRLRQGEIHFSDGTRRFISGL